MLKRFGRWIICLGLAIMVSQLGQHAPPEAHAQTCVSPNWEGRYYNSTDFSGNPVFSSCDPLIDFNWGTGAPAGGVNFDNFSLRLTSTQTFNTAGTYLFSVTVEDGVRVFINGSPIINSMVDANAPRTLTANHEVTAAGATAFITVEMTNFVGNAQLQMTWSLAGGGNAQQVVPNTNTNPLTVLSDGGGQPWNISYFANESLQGNAIYFDSAPADGIAIDYGAGVPSDVLPTDNWSARWQRVVDFTQGVYTFTLRADDAARVYINETEILNQTEYTGGQSLTVNVEIPAGRHTITVEHVELLDLGNLFLTWEPPVGTTLFSDGCNSALAGNYGSAEPCPDRVLTTGVSTAITQMPVVVRAGPLNFRPFPSQTATATRTISEGESYTALGRSGDNIWVQLEVDGVIGWSMSEFLTLQGDINTLAVTDGSAGTAVNTASDTTTTTNAPALPSVTAQPAAATVQAQALGNMRIRETPSNNGTRIGNVDWGEVVGVLGISRDGFWLQIQVGNVTGWSSRSWYEIISGDANSLPIRN